MSDPFINQLTALKQLDTDLNALRAEMLTALSFVATQATAGQIKVKTDNLDVPLSSITPVIAHAVDTGSVLVPDTLTAGYASTFHCTAISLVNISAAPVTLTLTDGSGNEYLKDFPLGVGVGSSVVIPYYNMTFAGGFQWIASVVSAIRGQVVGDL